MLLSCSPVTSTPLIKNHLNFWKRLPLLYERLNDQLYNQQKGMLGMLFREAVANLEHYTQGTEKQHFFVGFNALNKSESQIIQEFVSQEAGSVIWDIDRCFFLHFTLIQTFLSAPTLTATSLNSYKAA